MNIPADIRALEAQLIAWRRDFHRHPELGLQEHRTAGIIADTLRALGYEVYTGMARTGVVGLLHNGAGPTLLLRADMDALPIQEETTAMSPFCWESPRSWRSAANAGRARCCWSFSPARRASTARRS